MTRGQSISSNEAARDEPLKVSFVPTAGVIASDVQNNNNHNLYTCGIRLFANCGFGDKLNITFVLMKTSKFILHIKLRGLLWWM